MSAITGYVDEGGLPVLYYPGPSTSVVPAPVPRTVTYVAPPGPDTLTVFLGWPPMDDEQTVSAQAHLDRALALVGAYTRGQGFATSILAAPLAQVVLSLAARSMTNPTGDARVTAGGFAASPGQPEFTLNEKLIMNEYRRRAA